MVNNNAFELSDEQLEAVTGGVDAGNGLFANIGSTLANTQTNLGLNVADAGTLNASGINFGGLSQTGSTVSQSTSSTQASGNA